MDFSDIKWTECDFFQKVKHDLVQDELEGKFDSINQKIAEDYAYLRHRVVGFE